LFQRKRASAAIPTVVCGLLLLLFFNRNNGIVMILGWASQSILKTGKDKINHEM
jgi:ABC-type sulfate transport system permease component